MPIDLPPLYPITDTRVSGLSHAEQILQLSKGGATFVQLREKHLSPGKFYVEAEAALKVARQCGMRLIINDRVDIAFALGADGVHLGQDDLAPADARGILGAKSIIGASTHSVAQLVEACSQPIDYVALGPIFNTSSKESANPILGLEGLRAVRDLVGPMPLIAIGGITINNARNCISAGADSVAIITAILGDPGKISSKVHGLLASLEKPARS